MSEVCSHDGRILFGLGIVAQRHWSSPNFSPPLSKMSVTIFIALSLLDGPGRFVRNTTRHWLTLTALVFGDQEPWSKVRGRLRLGARSTAQSYNISKIKGDAHLKKGQRD